MAFQVGLLEADRKGNNFIVFFLLEENDQDISDLIEQFKSHNAECKFSVGENNILYISVKDGLFEMMFPLSHAKIFPLRLHVYASKSWMEPFTYLFSVTFTEGEIYEAKAVSSAIRVVEEEFLNWLRKNESLG